MSPLRKLLEIRRDVDHAQKRLFELRTGVRGIHPQLGEQRRRGRAARTTTPGDITRLP